MEIHVANMERSIYVSNWQRCHDSTCIHMQVDHHIMRPHIVMNLIIIYVRDGIIFALYVL